MKKEIITKFDGKEARNKLPEMYEWTRKEMEKWVEDPTNRTSKKDLEAYDRGEWVFYIYTEYNPKTMEGVSKLTIGKTEQNIFRGGIYNNPPISEWDECKEGIQHYHKEFSPEEVK